MPVGWAPVWLVTDGRKISAHYCGADLRFEQPVHGDYPDRKSVKRWRDILWASRCRTEPPAFQPERKLWQAYVEFAHDV
jgi:hypothetical protein